MQIKYGDDIESDWKVTFDWVTVDLSEELILKLRSE